MKKLALLATLIFSVMFPSTSHAEWTKAGKYGSGECREGNSKFAKWSYHQYLSYLPILFHRI